MSQQRDIIEQKPGESSQIVRIRSDSETNLDDLFSAILHNGNTLHQRPMRQRNLPASFFKEPERGSKSACHSRESSTDNTYPSPPPPQVIQNKSNDNDSTAASPPSVIRYNAFSPPPPTIPSGLQIIHPRAHSSPASLQQTLNAVQHKHFRNQSYDITMPLPQGWEMAMTAEGRPYFLNHADKSTTWDDPRKNSSTGSLSSSSGITCSTPSSSPASSLINLQLGNSLGPLPEGWEQCSTSKGEIYFINHMTKKIIWDHQRQPAQLQSTPVVPILNYGVNVQNLLESDSHQSRNSASALTNSLTLNNQTQQQQQTEIRIQSLQLEREKYRMRQQEILRNPNLGNPNLMANDFLRRNFIDENSPNSSSDSRQLNATNLDPFLNADVDFHSRQKSGDSGLGLITNYSMPNTPEDYLMGMDEGAEEVLQDIADLNLESLPVPLDLVPESMDSDDLEPSLHVFKSCKQDPGQPSNINLASVLNMPEYFFQNNLDAYLRQFN